MIDCHCDVTAMCGWSALTPTLGVGGGVGCGIVSRKERSHPVYFASEFPVAFQCALNVYRIYLFFLIGITGGRGRGRGTQDFGFIRIPYQS